MKKALGVTLCGKGMGSEEANRLDQKTVLKLSMLYVIDDIVSSDIKTLDRSWRENLRLTCLVEASAVDSNCNFAKLHSIWQL